MRTAVRTRGFDISYRVDGEGPPLLLLHGWSRWADTWWEAGYGDALNGDYRVIAVDWIGHGESDKPHDPADYREAPIVADLVAVLDAEQVDRTLVWGFSMGARHAATLAVLEPERVAALVCGGMAPLPALEGRRERILGWAESVRGTEQMEAFLRGLGSVDEVIAESVARNDAEALSAAVAGIAEWTPDAKDVQAPSLWYEGANDDPFSPEALDLASRLGVETRLIPDADHVQSFRWTDEVLAVVRPFLERHRSAASTV
ncbi:MAG: alpha/beta fold hydrolase [Microthrixaceae bacterium]